MKFYVILTQTNYFYECVGIVKLPNLSILTKVVNLIPVLYETEDML